MHYCATLGFALTNKIQEEWGYGEFCPSRGMKMFDTEGSIIFCDVAEFRMGVVPRQRATVEAKDSSQCHFSRVQCHFPMHFLLGTWPRP